VIAACETTGAVLGGGGSSGAPSVNQRLELALAVEDEAEAVVAALTLSGPGVPPGFVAPTCPTVGSIADTDGDGIPNDQTLTFTNPPCTVVGLRPGTLGVTGTVRIQDSTASDSSSYRLTFTDLAWTAVDTVGGTRGFTATRNGTRSRTATDSSTVLNTNMTIVRQRAGRANTTITLTSLAEFTADTVTPPDTVKLGLPLPKGTLTITGNLNWRRSTENWDLAIATPTPLAFDTTCTTTPQRISTGALTLTGTISGANGVLTLTWAGCGADPTRTWTATP
jgi:hypothetical protein